VLSFMAAAGLGILLRNTMMPSITAMDSNSNIETSTVAIAYAMHRTCMHPMIESITVIMIHGMMHPEDSNSGGTYADHRTGHGPWLNLTVHMTF
jgi:hypothetical protein